MRMWYIDIYFFLALSPKTGSTLYINLMLFKASSLAAQLKNVIADGSFSSPAKISVLPVTCATWGNSWPMDTLMWMWQHFSLSSVGGVLHLIRICLEWHLPTPAVVPQSTFLPFSLSFFFKYQSPVSLPFREAHYRQDLFTVTLFHWKQRCQTLLNEYLLLNCRENS